ncbi:MAG: RidA family protein [Anaerolineales bacterium]|nr:RidA family protein [Anaerolineales bacterium]
MTKNEIVTSEHTPKAIGPYSPAVRSGEFVFTAGQLGLDPATGILVAGGVAAETRQALQHCARLLEAAGGALPDIVKTTVYLRSMEDFSAMNAVYAEFFPNDPPARTSIQAAALPKGAAVEIECIARIPVPRKPVRRRK